MQGFEKAVMDGISRRMDNMDVGQGELSRRTGLPQSNISRWIRGESSPQLNSIGPIVDFLGGRVVWPGQDGVSMAVNVELRGKGAGEWRSIPVISWQIAGRFPRRAIGKDEVINFVLQHATHRSVAGRDDVIALVVGEHRAGMAPEVQPGDTVFIDMSQRSMTSDAISLFRDPTGELRLCRVTTKKAGPDLLFLVTEDAKPGQTDVFSLSSDFGGTGNLESIVIGEVTGLLR